MQKSRILIIIVAILVLLNVCTLSFLWVQHKSSESVGAGPSTKDFVIREIGLTPAQQVQYDSLRKTHHENMMSLNEQGRKLHDQLFENISIEIIDSALIQNISSQISSVEIENQKNTLYHFRQLRKMLTHEQQNKFDKIIQDVLRMLGNPGPKHGGMRHPKPRAQQLHEDENDLPPPPEDR